MFYFKYRLGSYTFVYFLKCTLQGIDVKSMGRIFVGLVKCGAWGCFDEFNRLEEAVLSAVSMQIQAIQDSLKQHKKTCDLLGKEVRQFETRCRQSFGAKKQLLLSSLFICLFFCSLLCSAF